jgi:hypothetical protein
MAASALASAVVAPVGPGDEHRPRPHPSTRLARRPGSRPAARSTRSTRSGGGCRGTLSGFFSVPHPR